MLQVISSSSGDLQPVFVSILANATRICEADFGVLVLYDNAAFRVAATTMRRQPLSSFGSANRRSVPAGRLGAWSLGNSWWTFRTASRTRLISVAMLISSGLLTFAGSEA